MIYDEENEEYILKLDVERMEINTELTLEEMIIYVGVIFVGVIVAYIILLIIRKKNNKS